MSSNFAYANTRDIEFVLGEWLPTENIFNLDRYAGKVEKADIPEFLESIRVLSKTVLEPADLAGEEFGVTFEDTHAGCAPEHKEAFATIQMDGWGTSSIDDDPDAWAMPHIVFAAGQEMMAAGCVSVSALVTLTTGVADLIQTYGSEEVKEIFLPKLFEGEWTGAMCLTETTAGSDTGAMRTRAKVTDDPRIFNIEGNKQFISYGDHDLTDNIVYALLARVEGAKPGVKGLSLFIVPRYWPNEDGTLEDNGVYSVGIEEKMGLHGMPTLRLAFGLNGTCRGWLLGENPLDNDGNGTGIAQMFKLMNFARLGVGFASLGFAANAVYNARDYCKERVQGSLYGADPSDKTTIIHHDDVRRALMAGKSQVDAMRAMLYKTAYYYDLAHTHPDSEMREQAGRWVSFTTPLCKAYPSDTVWEIAAEQLQLFGGYGYCEDFPLAKIARDSKIESIWEGTNYIQASDLVFRKFEEHDRQSLTEFRKAIAKFLKTERDNEELKSEFVRLRKAVESFDEIVSFVQNAPYHLKAEYAKRILTATAQLYASWCILDQATLAVKCLKGLEKTHPDWAFYQGKIASARYYLRNITPSISLLAECLKDPDPTAIEADLEIFEF